MARAICQMHYLFPIVTLLKAVKFRCYRETWSYLWIKLRVTTSQKSTTIFVLVPQAGYVYRVCKRVK